MFIATWVVAKNCRCEKYFRCWGMGYLSDIKYPEHPLAFDLNHPGKNLFSMSKEISGFMVVL